MSILSPIKVTNKTAGISGTVNAAREQVVRLSEHKLCKAQQELCRSIENMLAAVVIMSDKLNAEAAEASEEVYKRVYARRNETRAQNIAAVQLQK